LQGRRGGYLGNFGGREKFSRPWKTRGILYFTLLGNFGGINPLWGEIPPLLALVPTPGNSRTRWNLPFTGQQGCSTPCGFSTPVVGCFKRTFPLKILPREGCPGVITHKVGVSSILLHTFGWG